MVVCPCVKKHESFIISYMVYSLSNFIISIKAEFSYKGGSNAFSPCEEKFFN